MRHLNILWFDDDLVPFADGMSIGRMRLQPWLRWFKTIGVSRSISVIEVNSLTQLREVLTARSHLNRSHADYLHALLIDNMFHEKVETPTNFRDLDSSLSNISLWRFSAGAQLIALLKCDRAIGDRPIWLEPYSSRHMALFSSSPQEECRAELEHLLGSSQSETIAVLSKQQGLGPTLEPSPGQDFLNWIEAISQYHHAK